MAMNLVGTMVVALAGIGILIMFVTGTLQSSVEDGFCYLANGIGMEVDSCPKPSDARHVEELEPYDTEELAIDVAARILDCWMEAVKPLDKQDVVCYEIFLNHHPGPVTEEDVTKILEAEGGCEIIQNVMVVNSDGEEVEFSGDCGENDEIDWQIYDAVIEEESLIRIEYDVTENRIVVKG